MEAAQKDLGDYERAFQNRGRKKVRGGPYRLFGLQDQGGRTNQDREKTNELLVDCYENSEPQHDFRSR